MIHNTHMKELFILQIKEQMKKQNMRKCRLALEAGCTRATLDRVLDKENNNINLSTIVNIGKALGLDLSIKLVDELEVKK